jgi:hypothetical protein
MEDKNKDLLEELMTLTIADLIEQIKNGEATSGHLGVARQLLRDNQITCSITESSPLSGLVDILPFDEYSEPDTREAKGL